MPWHTMQLTMLYYYTIKQAHNATEPETTW